MDSKKILLTREKHNRQPVNLLSSNKDLISKMNNPIRTTNVSNVERAINGLVKMNRAVGEAIAEHLNDTSLNGIQTLLDRLKHSEGTPNISYAKPVKAAKATRVGRKAKATRIPEGDLFRLLNRKTRYPAEVKDTFVRLMGENPTLSIKQVVKMTSMKTGAENINLTTAYGWAHRAGLTSNLRVV